MTVLKKEKKKGLEVSAEHGHGTGGTSTPKKIKNKK